MKEPQSSVRDALNLINKLFQTKLGNDLNSMEFTMSRKEVADVLNNVRMALSRDCIDLPDDLHPETRELVINFASKMGYKLRNAQVKYGFTNGWRHPNWDTAKGNDQFEDPTQCIIAFSHHIDKGDPVDVANYCAFMDWHGWSTKYVPTPHTVTIDNKGMVGSIKPATEPGYGTDYVGSIGDMPQ
jgi:predicted metalloendopeptidase